ncbi:MAG: hypothetical protein GXO66_06125 [Euryarchaeota archaeon]|nr:hypothetical protein [Euryarchaeota archaeon]
MKRNCTVPVLLLLLAGAVAATSHPDYVPDSGYYYISKSYAYSDFVWNEQGFNEWYPEAYEHEFRVENTGFAKYAGYWSSNLPQKYLDLEDDAQNSANTWDEFVVGSDDAEATVPGQEYWMYIDLSDQDSSVVSSRTILEAELKWDLPGTGANWPVDYYPIRDFTAPSSGTWNFASSSSTSGDRLMVMLRPESGDEVERYISQRKKVLRKLAEEMPEGIMHAVVSLDSFASTGDVDSLFRDYRVEVKAVWFEARGYGFGGGFDIQGSVTESLDRKIGDLKADMTRTEEALDKAKRDESAALLRVLRRQEMMILALSEGAAEIYGVEVEGRLRELQKLQENTRIALVDVKYYPDAPRGAKIVQRPILPGR